MELRGLEARSAYIRELIRGGLVVSCQALENEPLHGPFFMAALAYAAEQGGAAGIRANSPPDLRAIRRVITLPLIGLWKVNYPGSDVYLTPTFAEAAAVAAAGADVVALDGTARSRPDGTDLVTLIRRVRDELERPVLADVSTLEEGLTAVEAGADFVSTALAGYTPYSRQLAGPDLELVAELAERVSVPVLAEGRLWTPEEGREALSRGAHAVVVGAAITRPQQITTRFAAALKG